MKLYQMVIIVCLVLVLSRLVSWDPQKPQEDVIYYFQVNRSAPDPYIVMKKACGGLCSLTNDVAGGRIFEPPPRSVRSNRQISRFFPSLVRARFDCRGLFSNPIFDTPALQWPPPKRMPSSLRRDYTLGVPGFNVQPEYYQQRYNGVKAMESLWTFEHVEDLRNQIRKGAPAGSYGPAATLSMMKATNASGVRGKHVAVVGSERPWLEAALLEIGVEHVTTIEYGAIISEHPQITTLTVREFNRKFLEGHRFDFGGVASFSSLEHSGLGRYGDMLNPWGDVIAVAKMWCTMQEGAPIIIGVPSSKGADVIYWNAHRIYGPHRWPFLLTNFKPRSHDRPDDGTHGVMTAYRRPQP